jgi:hypothetical protein
MLQHDYIVDLIQNFVAAITAALKGALMHGDKPSLELAESSVAELLDLDKETAFSLSPGSLVTMMQLSGIGDSTAGYVSYALRRIGDAYAKDGESDVAAVRRAQSNAIADAFGCPRGQVPKEFQGMEQDIQDEQGQE